MSNTSAQHFNCDCCNFNTKFKDNTINIYYPPNTKTLSTDHTQNSPLETIEDLKKQTVEMRSQINYLLEKDKNTNAI